MSKINNIEILRDRLTEVFDNLSAGKINIKTAAEMNNCAGKTIKSIMVQLEYYKLRKESPTINFMKEIK